MTTVFSSPARYTQGPGVIDGLPEEMKTLGLTGPLAIVCGPTVRGLLEARWDTVCASGGIDYSIIDFPGECCRDAIDMSGEAIRSSSARTVLGAGGGKVLDTARAAAANTGRPFISCPTLASTDSPCSALSVIYSPDGVYEGFETFGRNPDLVLVDTQVILESPERTFIAGLGDGVSTVFEARACRTGRRLNLRGGLATVAASQIGEACLSVLMADGRAALADMRQQELTETFERVVEANTLLSGIGFESAGLAAAHGLHNAMTVAAGTHAYMHGEKVAFGVMTHLAMEQQPESVRAEIRSFFLEVGLPVTLAQVGLDVEDETTLQTIAQAAVVPGGLMHNEPFEVTAEAVLTAMLEADRYGQAG